jgi:uncharacterized protein (DUF2336 family)
VSFLQELEVAVSQGSAESRERALWYVTDLLIVGRYTEDEIWMFGEIIGKLEQDIETATRARLSKRLARSDNAPFEVIKILAFDDAIEVAGPVLRQSGRLDTRTLIANARSKSQDHLLAISKRRSLCEELTDELVVRGNREVARLLAKNNGARFSDSGILHMIKRSESDSILFEQLGHRRDIPRHVFQQLIAKASHNTKKRLERERPEAANQINSLVTDVTGALQSKFGPASKDYFDAKREVAKQHQRGNLDQKQIFEYALSHRFAEATVGLALLCSLPVDVVERVLLDKNREIALILAKALAFSWETTMELLFLGAPEHRMSVNNLEAARQEFAGLSAEISRGVLEAYKLRKRTASSDFDDRRLPQLHAER